MSGAGNPGYASVAEEASARIRDWSWSEGASWYDPRPLWHERRGSSRPRVVRKEPGDFNQIAAVGVDEDGQPLVVREHDSRGRVRREQYRVDTVDRAEWLAWEHPHDGGPPRLQWQLQLSGPRNRPLFSELIIDARAVETERYIYDEDGRVRRISIERLMEPHREEYVADYDASGKLLQLTELVAGFGVVRRQVPKTLQPLMRAVEEALVEGALAAIESEPSAIVIAFSDLLPPVIGIATPGELDDLRAVWGDDFGAVWNPAHWTRTLQAVEDYAVSDSAAFGDACASLRQACADRDDDEPIAVVARAVARRLNASPAVLAAIAAEDSFDDISGDAARSAPTERLTELRARQLLPVEDGSMRF